MSSNEKISGGVRILTIGLCFFLIAGFQFGNAEAVTNSNDVIIPYLELSGTGPQAPAVEPLDWQMFTEQYTISRYHGVPGTEFIDTYGDLQYGCEWTINIIPILSGKAKQETEFVDFNYIVHISAKVDPRFQPTEGIAPNSGWERSLFSIQSITLDMFYDSQTSLGSQQVSKVVSINGSANEEQKKVDDAGAVYSNFYYHPVYDFASGWWGVDSRTDENLLTNDFESFVDEYERSAEASENVADSLGVIIELGLTGAVETIIPGAGLIINLVKPWLSEPNDEESGLDLCAGDRLGDNGDYDDDWSIIDPNPHVISDIYGDGSPENYIETKRDVFYFVHNTYPILDEANNEDNGFTLSPYVSFQDVLTSLGVNVEKPTRNDSDEIHITPSSIDVWNMPPAAQPYKPVPHIGESINGSVYEIHTVTNSAIDFHLLTDPTDRENDPIYIKWNFGNDADSGWYLQESPPSADLSWTWNEGYSIPGIYYPTLSVSDNPWNQNRTKMYPNGYVSKNGQPYDEWTPVKIVVEERPTYPRIDVKQNEYGWFASDPGDVINVDFYDDGGSDLKNARYKIGDSGDWTTIFSDITPSYETDWGIDWTNLDLVDGVNTIFIEVYNVEDNVDSATITYKKDTTPCLITRFEVNGNDEWTNDRNAMLSIDASDFGSGVSSMRFINEDGYGGKWYSEPTSLDSTHPVLPGDSQQIIVHEDGASSIRVHFNVIDTRENLDYVYVKDSNNNIINTYTGLYTNELTLPVPGDYAMVEIVCDMFDTFGSWGFSIDEYQYYAEEWSEWQSYETSASWTLSEGYGSKTVYCQVKDYVDLVSDIASDQIDFRPFGTSILINDDAQYTNTDDVDLSLYSDISPISMRFTNVEDPTPTWHYGGDPNINNARDLWWRSDLLIPSVDSDHNYIGSGAVYDYYVKAPSSSATEMRVVFPDIQLWEHPTSPSTYDKITLHDGTYLPTNPHYDDIYDSYRGTQSWVESEIIPSNSVRIRLESETVSPGDWGFSASQVNWRNDNLYYPNGFDQTWSISKAEALKMKVTFSSINLGAGDILTVWDSSGTLATFVGESRGQTTVAGNSGNTIWIRLENINENTRGWGFDISRWDYYYDSSWTDWEPWANSKSWTLASGDDGNKIVWMQVKDSEGNIVPDSDDIVLDTTSPNIPSTSLSTSSPYIYISSNNLFYSDLMGTTPHSFTASGTATNGGSGLLKATATYAFGDLPPDDFNADSWSFQYDIVDTDAGSGTITVWVYDNAGNSNSVPFNYYEDKDGPRIWNTWPPNSYVLTDQTPYLSWDFSDLTGGISDGYTVQISPDSSFSTISDEVHLYDEFIEWPNSLSQGTHYWRVLAQDRVGNVGIMPTKSFSIDLTLPTTGISSPNNGDSLTGVLDIIGTASDMNFQSYSLEVGFGTSPALFTEIASSTSAVSNGLLGTWDTTDKVKNGDWTIRLTAVDVVGHVNQYSIVVDVDNPVVIDDLEVSNIRLDDMTCSFYLNENQIVSAWVEDSSSSVVKNIYQNKFMLAGQYSSGVRWDWTNSIGDLVPNGDYTIFVDSTSAPAASVDVFIRNAPTVTVSSGLGTVNPTFSWSNPIGSGATWFISSDNYGYYETSTSTSITLHIQEPSVTIEVYGVNQNYITRVGSITYSPQLAKISGTFTAPSEYWSSGNGVTVSVTIDSRPDLIGWQPSGVACAYTTTGFYQIYVPSGYYRVFASTSAHEWVFDGYNYKFLSVSVGSSYTMNGNIIKRTYPTGGGCPYVYAWNGSEYQMDNNILPGSEYQSDLAPDTTNFFKLNVPVEPVDDIIPLAIGEFESEYSIFDSFELLCIDHDGSNNIAMDTEGNIRTFSNAEPPISCVDNNGNDQLSNISTIDEPYFMGYKGDWLEMEFGPADSETTKLIVQSDLKPGTGGPISPAGDNEVPGPINVQILDEWGQWQHVDDIYPRNFWYFDIVDLSNHVEIGQELVVRLEWEAYHHLAFVGIDNAIDSDVNIINAELIQSDHIYYGDVTNAVKYSDGQYIDLDKNEYLTLNFSYIEKTDIVRDYVLVSKGYYCYRNDRPIANFTSIPSVSETYDPVYFDARESESSVGEITGYYYFFGDGTESGWLTQPITYHEYEDDGTYNVTLIVKDDHEPPRVDVSYLTVIILNQPPEAAFDVYQDVDISLRVAGRKGNTVTCQIYEDGILIHELPITRTTGIPNVGTISFNKYVDREYEIIVVYEARHKGTNPMWLTINSGDYCYTEFMELKEKNGDNQEYDVTSLVNMVSENNLEYTFDASNSFDIDGDIVSYEWNFGDGHTGTGEIVSHTFEEHGIYLIALTVEDDDGLTDSVLVDLEI